MYKLYHQHKTYFQLLFCWIVTLGFALLVFGNHHLFLMLHKDMGSIADWCFRWITELVSTTGSCIVVLLLLIRNWREGTKALIAMVSSTIVTHVLKIWVDAPRPWVYFNNETVIRSIKEVTLLPNHSFPSGHSTAAFALATALVFTFNDKRWSIFFFVMAVLVGYSRIYLGQHFPLDVWVGSMIGILSATLIWTFVVFKKKEINLS
ncbi:phosphatase PAP2 family protein [Solitalea sp. MAHUQ-68]|uniref:Phosphatase PAP2 family protein n=1 Tax=Solitalea agri TaxID=2953739 RepID=A0A9X2F4D6_9SPHI|nr:phosphatase PAP2 family protein [Solitalea agri]MCO4294015.1 phosphatase PAP2 family protein [Solitalea agri]